MLQLTLRPMRSDDLERLMRITNGTGFFTGEELDVAREVLADAGALGEESGYLARVAERDGTAIGYVCFGPAPMTRGTWNVYWLAVDPASQRGGVGRRLMKGCETEIGNRMGRLVLVETSSKDLYSPTREFYLSIGYREVSRITGFYDVGDDRVTYAKTLSRRRQPPDV